MTDQNISVETWNDYLENLYNWIQEKYNLFEIDAIPQQEYNEHLSYYLKEKERIENIIESIKNADKTRGQEIIQTKDEDKFELSQERFEEFFGVKLEEELDKIKEEKEMQQEAREQEEELWDFISEDHDKISGFETEAELDEEGYRINIILIGDSAVGRTSLRRAWMGKHFVESHLTTIGASIEKKSLKIDGQPYHVTVTDLGGQDFYSGLRRNFYRNIDGAILVFDLTRPETFRRLDFWIKEMYREINTLIPFILVGNKNESDNRKIPEKYGIRASAQFSRTTLPKFRVRYMETSAKAGYNVNEIFETICREARDLKFGEETV